MKKLIPAIFIALACISCTQKQSRPLALCSENQHYLLFRGKPVVLIGSTEHYGAVMNLAFNYSRYLDELAANGLNLTRLFTGAYREHPLSFNIMQNTLAPDSGNYICAWSRSGEAGYLLGGNKYDLNQWDTAYFERLRSFITEAGKRKIIVEVNLFSNFYDTTQWVLSPWYARNNVNGVGEFIDHKEVLSLMHPDLLKVQESYVQKMVSELKNYDNIYYEICNEPYFGDLEALADWQEHMTNVVAEAEKKFAFPHLISHNVANGSAKVEKPNPHVSIFNFHYAAPPVTVGMNYGLNRVIGDNETGFAGTGDTVYRMEAWNFILAGGALFNHLDYSFTAAREDGTYAIPATQPGGGGKILRAQFGILHTFINGFDFIRMSPQDSLIKNSLPAGMSSRMLGEPGKAYALYLGNKPPSGPVSVSLTIQLPPGKYRIDWIDTKTGLTVESNHVVITGGFEVVLSPVFMDDIAAKIMHVDS